MNQLPESIRRESKRLLKLAKQSDGILRVTSLSQAQELVSRIKGSQNAFDALQAKTLVCIHETNLALAVGEVANEDFVQYWTEDPSDLELVLSLASNNLTDFEVRAHTSTPEWDPTLSTHMNMRHEIAISLRGCRFLPNLEELFALAKVMFEVLQARDGGFVFCYCDEIADNDAIPPIDELI